MERHNASEIVNELFGAEAGICYVGYTAYSSGLAHPRFYAIANGILPYPKHFDGRGPIQYAVPVATPDHSDLKERVEQWLGHAYQRRNQFSCWLAPTFLLSSKYGYHGLGTWLLDPISDAEEEYCDWYYAWAWIQDLMNLYDFSTTKKHWPTPVRGYGYNVSQRRRPGRSFKAVPTPIIMVTSFNDSRGQHPLEIMS